MTKMIFSRIRIKKLNRLYALNFLRKERAFNTLILSKLITHKNKSSMEFNLKNKLDGNKVLDL